jgi:hypothetical protein
VLPTTSCTAPSGKIPIRRSREDRVRHVGRRGRGLDDARHAGQKRGREFLEHPPAREVVGVDEHRDAVQRRHDVARDERALLPDQFDIAVEHEALVGQFFLRARSVGEQRADAAVDIEGVIALGRARVVGEVVERGLAIVEVRRQLLSIAARS